MDPRGAGISYERGTPVGARRRSARLSGTGGIAMCTAPPVGGEGVGKASLMRRLINVCPRHAKPTHLHLTQIARFTLTQTKLSHKFHLTQIA